MSDAREKRKRLGIKAGQHTNEISAAAQHAWPFAQSEKQQTRQRAEEQSLRIRPGLGGVAELRRKRHQEQDSHERRSQAQSPGQQENNDRRQHTAYRSRQPSAERRESDYLQEQKLDEITERHRARVEGNPGKQITERSVSRSEELEEFVHPERGQGQERKQESRVSGEEGDDAAGPAA